MRAFLLIIGLPLLLLAILFLRSEANRDDSSPGPSQASDAPGSERSDQAAFAGADSRKGPDAEPGDAPGSRGLGSGSDSTSPRDPDDPDSALADGAEGSGSAAERPHVSPPELEALSPEIQAQVRALKAQGADPQLRRASDGSTFVEVGGAARFVPVATYGEDGRPVISEH